MVGPNKESDRVAIRARLPAAYLSRQLSMISLSPMAKSLTVSALPTSESSDWSPKAGPPRFLST